MSHESYVRYNIFFLSLLGMCKIKTDSAIKRILLRLWRYLLGANMFYFIVSSVLNYKTKKVSDFQELFVACFYSISGVNMLLKMIYFYAFDGVSDEIIKGINDLFRYETQTGMGEKTLEKTLNFVRKLSCYWIGFCSACALGDIIAFIVLNQKSERILPLQIWYPFDWKVSPYYELTIAYEVFLAQVITLCFTTADMFFVSTVLLTNAQFNFLGWELRCLVQTTLLKRGIDKADVCRHFVNEEKSPKEESGSEDSPQYGASITIADLLNAENVKVDLLRGLMRLAQCHQALVKFCALLEEFFSPLFLPFLLLTTIGAIFMTSCFTVKLDATLKISAGLGLMGFSVSLFWPCYLGQLLLSQSESLSDDLYASHWYLCDASFNSSFKILSYGASKPIRLTFGKFANLSLVMFLQVTKAIVSYVIFLYQVAASRQK